MSMRKYWASVRRNMLAERKRYGKVNIRDRYKGETFVICNANDDVFADSKKRKALPCEGEGMASELCNDCPWVLIREGTDAATDAG